MPTSRSFPAYLLLLCYLLPLSAFALSDVGDYVSRQGEIDDDYYVAGAEVDIDAVIKGDVIAAGGEVIIGKNIQGDVLAAGGQLLIQGRVSDDIRSAGGQVKIDAEVDDDLFVSGGSIDMSASSSVAGDARLAGGDVNMAGSVAGNLSVAAGNIRLSGSVDGDVELSGAEIHITQGARINGNLHYKSPRMAIIDPDAIIQGNLTHQQAEWEQPGTGPGIVLPLTLIVAGMVWYLLFPRFTLASVALMRQQAGKSLLMGLVLLIVIPVVGLILMVTVLGLWIGLSLVLVYLLALLAGYLLACFFVADWGATLFKQDISSRGRRLLAFVLAVIVIGLLGMLPLLGGLLVFVLLLLGLGGGALQLQLSYQHSGET